VLFQSPPSVWSAYARVLAARKPALVPAGQQIGRLEAALARVRLDPAHLARYRSVCGIAGGRTLPITYPHVLATPVHLALLSSPRFPVRLLGLVHVANVIEQRRPLEPEDGGHLLVWLDGHRDTPRGQEFDLETEWRQGERWIWRETCTFLARRRDRGRDALHRHAAAEAAVGAPVECASFRAPAGLGREYGLVSGDVNPIHLADATARAFGFKAAIAHGMWSLARCAAELPSAAFDGHVRYEVQFKLPVFLPAWLMLERWPVEDGGMRFALRDSQGERPHLVGRLQPVR
jgi:acyl dehydratase